MLVLVDTNVFLRCQVAFGSFPAVQAAVQARIDAGDSLVVTSQVVSEAYVALTRPLSVNGYGLNALQAVSILEVAESLFTVVHEPASAYQSWKTLITRHQVLGKQTHDARIVASMLSLGVTHILTMNGKDFERYPEIKIIEP